MTVHKPTEESTFLKGRFGEELFEAGFVSFPVLLLAYQDLLFLTPAELNTIEQIWMDWWIGENFPPALETIAQRIGRTKRWLQNVLKDLRVKDLLTRAGKEAPAWAKRINATVQEEVSAYCATSYREAHSPPFGYLLIIQQKTSWGMQQENWYDFFPLLSYLRALYREEIRPIGHSCHGGVKKRSPIHDIAVMGGRRGLHPRGEAAFTPMVMEKENREGKGRVLSDFRSAAIHPTDPVTATSSFADPLSSMLVVLDHFVNRATERWLTLGDQGQLPARNLQQRYEVAQALLAPEVTPATVAQAPADLVEELLILSQVLWDREPVELVQAIDRALAREDKGPCHRLACVWPRVPRAVGLKKRLKRLLREGKRLPQGDQFQAGLKLFVCLNRFAVGPPLQEQFLALCRQKGVRPVKRALDRALEDNRPYVTIKFLQKAVSRVTPAAPSSWTESDSSPPESDPVGQPESEGPSTTEQASPINLDQLVSSTLHRLGEFQDRQRLPWVLQLWQQSGLGEEEFAAIIRAAEQAVIDEPRAGGYRLQRFLEELRARVHGWIQTESAGQEEGNK